MCYFTLNERIHIMKNITLCVILIFSLLWAAVPVSAQDTGTEARQAQSNTSGEKEATIKAMERKMNRSIRVIGDEGREFKRYDEYSPSSIKRKKEELILLKRLIRENKDPQEGVDELLRQEKMRLLIEKVNKNLAIIDRARQEQEKQMEIIESQRAVLNQQRNLPKR